MKLTTLCFSRHVFAWILRKNCLLVSTFLIGLLISPGLFAAPPDLTAGGVPTTTKNPNLGPTGLHGWVYHVNDNTSESRQILVTSVDVGSPAEGVIAVDDVILGADGTGATATNFTSDAFRALAAAISDAEARSPATLSLVRWRAGVTTTETITLQTMGSYTATAPYNCPKSELILAQGLDYVMANQDAGRYSFGTLALLAANDPSDPNNAARMARAQTDALGAMPSQAELDDINAGIIPDTSSLTWSVGHRLIVLSEYYLATGDTQVLPGIEALALWASRGQSLLGTIGHRLNATDPDGSYNGTYKYGYGVVNSAGMPCYLGLILAKQCGLTNPEIEPAIARAGRFYASYAGYGAIPYGEHEPYRKAHEANGKSGLAAVCFALEGGRDEEGKFFSQMATGAGSEREQGHTGPYFNYLWAPLGAAAGGESAAAEHFSRISWHLDLCRRWDGGFDFNTLWDGGNGGVEDWQGFQMFVPALLTYALPLRQLAITGRNPNTNLYLSAGEVSNATFADDYDETTRTTNELVSDLGFWSPKVQLYAADEIGKRTSEHAALIPQLIAIANDTNAGRQRAGACLALGEIGDGSAAADLANLLDDSDALVRYASAEALRYLPQADKLAQLDTILIAADTTGTPFDPLSDDPIQFAHHRLSMLLFYSGNAYGPKGVIWGTGINGVDRNLLYPAIRAVAGNPNGQGRSTLGETYRNLTQADVEALAGTIIDSVKYRSPADKMFSGGVRSGGLDALQAFNFAEGVPLCRGMVEEFGTQNGEKSKALNVLEAYAGSSSLVAPDPQIVDFCEFLVFTNPTLAADAQLVLDAIAADTTPATPTPFKTLQSITADATSLTMPSKWTQLHVSATDVAQGDSIYTWRKVHGAGEVIFTPNGTASAEDTTVYFDGTPGQYLFEVTMSDSRELTEVYGTIMVTLYDTGGELPSNSPPTASGQSITVTQATTAPIVLGGTDPEGYALTYSITTPPANGTLIGDAPYLSYTSDFNFTGADSFTFEVMDSEGQAASATVNITVDPTSGLETAVYEPFDYPAGLLNGQSGATEVGLDGVWTASTASAYISDGSLTYSSVFTAGGKFEPTGASNHFGGARTISTSALQANGLLDNGSTLWFSAIVGYGATANGTNARLAVALANDSFNGGNYDYWIKNDGPQLGQGVGFVMGRHDGTNGRVKAALFQDQSQGEGFAGNIYGTWEGNGALYTVGGNPGLIVARITWAEDPLDDDIIEIFQPNTDLSLPTSPISVLSVNVDQTTYDTLTFSRGDKPLLDEIRLGGTYHSVMLGTLPMSPDATAPAPDPLGFEIAPIAVNGTSVTMTAAEAFDASGVEYYFTCTAGGGNDSGWQSSRTYTDSGLNPGVQYSYTITARDLSPAQNTTSASATQAVTLPSQLLVPDVVGMMQPTAESIIASQSFTVGTVSTSYDQVVPAGEVISQSPVGETTAAVGSPVDLTVSLGPDPDTTPPTPNPMTFAVAPYSTGTTSISMTATTASDPAGVEYYFTCTSGGGNDSGWQDSSTYEDTGLTPNTSYGYTVTARDKSLNNNAGAPSSAASATTDNDGSGITFAGITSFDPNTYFNGGVTAGIDFDDGSPTQAGFAGIPASNNTVYSIINNGVTFDVVVTGTTTGNQNRDRGAIGGDLVRDFEQWYNNSGGLCEAHVQISGLVPDTEHEIDFFMYNIGAGQTTQSFFDGTSSAAPLITTFTTSGNQTDFSTWSPGVTLTATSDGSGVIDITVQSQSNGRLTLNGISVVDTTPIPNYPPTWAGNPVVESNAMAKVGYSATLSDDASDADTGDILTFAKVSGPAWLDVADNGDLTGTPDNADIGLNTFTVSVSDGINPAVETLLEITVDSNPLAELATGVTLNFEASDAASGIDSSNWNSLTANSTQNLTFGAGITLENITSSGLTKAYRFTGNGGDIDNPDWQSSFIETDDASLEFWIKPDDGGAAGQTIFEAGGTGDGLAVWYEPGSIGDDLGTVFFTIDNGATQNTVSAVIDTTDFIQITCVYDKDAGGKDIMQIWVNGLMVDDNAASTTFDDTADVDTDSLNDWSGSDGPGYGATSNVITETANGGNYSGDIAVLRFWESKALTSAEIAANYAHVRDIIQTSVPDVVGLSQLNAEANIVAASLSVGTVISQYDAVVPAGDVISQSPSGSTVAAVGDSVDLVVSLGPPLTTVPNVVGLAQATAESNITAANLVVGNVSYQNDAVVPAGDVISQNPSGGASVAEGSSVDLVVSLGPPMTTVPDVIGLAQATAESDITAANLVVGNVTSQYDSVVPTGDVISQNPTGGSNVIHGSTVDLVVSLGPPQTTVPNVVGLAQATAESNITAANLVVGNVTSQYDAGVPAGDVISQSPTGGSTVDEGTSVDLVVSLGPPLTTVPNVVGQAQATAESNIVAANLTVGTITQANSETVPTGDVISQGLTAGSSVPEGSAVDLVISLGPAATVKLVRTTVAGVSNASWTTVDLGQTYTSPVIVATPIHPTGVTTPVVTRITNITSTGFDLKLDRADGLSGAVSYNVSVIAVEEGVYTQAADGVTMEAVKFTSTYTSGKSNWVGEARTYQNSYTNPTVVGQVMSYNDTNWSTFWSMGSGSKNPIDASNLNVGKHVGEDGNTTRADETIGYIVIESGNGTIDGVAYEAAMGGDSVKGFDDSSTPFNYTLSGSLGSVSAAALSQSAMDGNDGSWAVLYGASPLSSTNIDLYVSEDQINDSEQRHVNEQVGYIVFE